MKRVVVFLLILGLLPFSVIAQKKDQVPKIPAPPIYRGVENPNAPPDALTLADTKWFDIFRDEKLQELVHEALTYNYDLREAVARIDLARANLGLTRSEQFPQIVGSADLTTVGRSRDGELTLPEPASKGRTFGSVLLNLLSFELDIWGRLRKQTQAARADLLATEEARKAVMTTVVSDVAGSYFVLRELDLELEIARRTLVSRQESLRIIKLREERGVSNMLEVRQAEELVYNATETIPALERSIEQTENFLNVLVGKNPGPIIRGLALTEEPLPVEVPAGISVVHAPLAVRRQPQLDALEVQQVARQVQLHQAGGPKRLHP
jgi:multidrug efflux system outer membrane protein